MKSKLVGGILLIAGTCIGGGMLGLPIATAKGGLVGSTLLFVTCWMLMTFTALLTLEVNICFPKDSNVISMAKVTLGRYGEVICWTIYLLFLYALVSAYIAGGQDVLHGLLINAGIDLPLSLCALMFVFIFGAIVMAGVKQVDFFNRLLMIIKFLTIFVLMAFIAMHINRENYSTGQIIYVFSSLTVAVTSFGFSIIVPSLRTYFNDDIVKLRQAILLGSFLPLLCYILWDAVIFGLIPLQGTVGLEPLLSAAQPISGLLDAINYYVPAQTITLLSRTFTSICVLTAFACVSLGLSDYLSDGFQVPKIGKGKWFITITTFLPPVLVVLFYPRAFILFLSIAGLLCLILQALMPAMMAWSCRYIKKMEGSYQVYGGKPLLLLTMIISTLMILISGYQIVVG